MDDKIILQGIQIFGHHGVSDEERAVGGRYSIDVELTSDLAAAGSNDSLEDTINYSQVYALVVKIGREQRFHLMEALATAIADALLAQFPCKQVLIRVKKQPPPIDGTLDYAGVEIRRVRS